MPASSAACDEVGAVGRPRRSVRRSLRVGMRPRRPLPPARSLAPGDAAAGSRVLAAGGRLELVAELLQEAAHRHRGGVGQQRRSWCRSCPWPRCRASRCRSSAALPSLEARPAVLEPAGALAARRALAAGLVGVEVRDACAARAPCQVVSSMTMMPAEPSIEPAFGDRVEVHRARRSRRPCSTGTDEPPGITALSLRPVGMPPAVLVDELAQRRAHRQLVDAGPLHVAATRSRASARGSSRGRCALNHVGAALDDVRHAGQRLDVVDDGRAAEHAVHARGTAA